MPAPRFTDALPPGSPLRSRGFQVPLLLLDPGLATLAHDAQHTRNALLCFLQLVRILQLLRYGLRAQVEQVPTKLIQLRMDMPAFAGQNMDLIGTANDHLLGFVRSHDGHRTIVLANFSDRDQLLDGNQLRTAGMGRFFEDAIGGKTFATSEPMLLSAYDILWLQRV